MLKARQPFPQAGSYALYEGEGAQEPARLLNLLRGDYVQISLVERPEASGYRTVRMADLVEADPLGAVERNEMRVLSAKLHGRKRPRARDVAKRTEFDADLARHEALRRRDIHAPILDRLLDQIEQREKARRAGPFFRRVSAYA